MVTINPGIVRRSADVTNMPAIRLLILFLILEYIRPYFLAQLKVQMIIIVAVLLLWWWAHDRPWSGILTAQVLFFIVCLTAIPLAYNYYAAYFTTRTMFGHVVIALGISWLMSTRPGFRTIAWAWLMIICYGAVYGLLHGGRGPGAFLGDENDLAIGCASAFPFAFFGFERLSGWPRWISGMIAVLLVVAIVESFSRGGFVGLAVASLYCFMLSRRKMLSFSILAFAIAVFFVSAPTSYITEIESIRQTNKGTAETRRFLWATAFNMWKAHPILGVGGGNFNFLAGDYQPSDFEGRDFDRNERSWSGTAVHSLFFQVLAEEGTIGILLVAYILWTHFQTLWQLRRDSRTRTGVPPDLSYDTELYSGALGGAMVGYCVAGAFLAVAYYPYLWYLSAMAVALDSAVRRELILSESRSKSEPLFGKQVASLLPKGLSSRGAQVSSMPRHRF